ncbi:MAG: hypothetical protein Fur0025_40500 [Oscillatoriaceae cyanobacterium]
MNYFPPCQPTLFPQPIPATVLESICCHQKGIVKFQGNYWHAKFYQNNDQITIPPGEPVTVIGREGNTLLVVIP